MEMEPEDLRDLESAVAVLEHPGFVVKLFDFVGKPIEHGLKNLPSEVSGRIETITKVSLEKALLAATSTMDPAQDLPSNAGLHRGLTGVSGALGGVFGLPALAIELPISTGIMLRSIAEIAREEGENVRTPLTQLACLEVFALGGKSEIDDAADSAYFATRFAIASHVNEAAKFVGRQGAIRMGKDAGPPLVRLISAVATRFGVTVTEKSAAQMIPVLGAVGGASINMIFTKHYQEMARGHFVVRRLERKYGEEAICGKYQQLLSELRSPDNTR